MANTKDELAEQLEGFAAGRPVKNLVSGRVTDASSEQEEGSTAAAAATATPRDRATDGLVFVLSGQGPQWYAMGAELIASHPVYAEWIRYTSTYTATDVADMHCDRRIDDLLSPLTGWRLEHVLQLPAAESPIDRTDYAQPAIFSLQVALVKLLEVRVHCSSCADG